MRTIYEPRGAAKEYAPLALNIYDGCEHGCIYCYSPACLHRKPADFHASAKPREGVIEALEKYLKRHAAEVRAKGPVLLSFTSDPYQPAEEEYHATQGAIKILAAHGCSIRLLTKAPLTAYGRDEYLFRSACVDFGTTLTGISDKDAKKWEPRAEIPSRRELGLLSAASTTYPPARMSTWLSMEPVIDIEGALATLRRLVGKVDRIMIGRWNHNAEANLMNWVYFLSEAMKILLPEEQKFYIKDSLWKSGRGDAMRERHGWLKERQ